MENRGTECILKEIKYSNIKLNQCFFYNTRVAVIKISMHDTCTWYNAIVSNVKLKETQRRYRVLLDLRELYEQLAGKL